MADGYLKALLTPSVREAEEYYYGRTYPSFDESAEIDRLRPEEIEFIQARDSFYLATVTEDGWPYLQHRGGPRGFLTHLGENRIGFADYGGNRQMISVGSLSTGDRISLFLMDYPNRHRLKILGNAQVLDARDHPDYAEAVAPAEGHGGNVERIFLIDVKSFDWNCPKFITPRYSKDEVEAAILPLQERIAELEAVLEERA